VSFPFDEPRWNKQDDGGAAYRARVEHWIDYSNKRGVWIVLDLHEYKAATPKHVKFWKDAAKRYANRPGVIFELLNEPHDISWREEHDRRGRA
jgi:endoglucanase